MFDPDANVTRINREMAYLTSGIGGRSMNSRRLNIINCRSMSGLAIWLELRNGIK